MRPPPAAEELTILLLSLLLSAATAQPNLQADSFCARAENAWKTVKAYDCTYRAVTFHEGKKDESVMRYSWTRPGKIRMDIEKPRRGAVLLYNPELSDKVRVRPFPKLGKMVLNYALTHPRVSSGGGGTVDQSDLGHRTQALVKLIQGDPFAVRFDGDAATVPDIDDGKAVLRRFTLGGDGLLRKIEVLDPKGQVLEVFEWTDLRKNPADWPPGLFEKF